MNKTSKSNTQAMFDFFSVGVICITLIGLSAFIIMSIDSFNMCNMEVDAKIKGLVDVDKNYLDFNSDVILDNFKITEINGKISLTMPCSFFKDRLMN